MKRKIIKFSKLLDGIYYNIASDRIIDKFIDDFKDEGQKNFVRTSNNSVKVVDNLSVDKKYFPKRFMKLNNFYDIPYFKLSIIDQAENRTKKIDFEIDISKVIKNGLLGIILFAGFALIVPLFSGEVPEFDISAIIISFSLLLIAGAVLLNILKIRTLLIENIRELKQEHDEKRTITQK